MRKVWDKVFRKLRVLPPNPDIVRVATLFSERHAGRILDLGCGMGRHTIYLAHQGFDVYGLDSSSKALMHTLTMLGEKGLAAHLALHDMGTLPYDDGYFDGLIGIQVIHHNRIADIHRTVGEIRRVLREGGCIWITMPTMKHEPSRRQEEVEPGTFVPLDGLEKGVPHHYFKMGEIPPLFTGFSVTDLHIDDRGFFSMVAEKASRT